MNYEEYDQELLYTQEEYTQEIPVDEVVNPDLQGLGNQYLEK